MSAAPSIGAGGSFGAATGGRPGPAPTPTRDRIGENQRRIRQLLALLNLDPTKQQRAALKEAPQRDRDGLKKLRDLSETVRKKLEQLYASKGAAKRDFNEAGPSLGSFFGTTDAPRTAADEPEPEGTNYGVLFGVGAVLWLLLKK